MATGSACSPVVPGARRARPGEWADQQDGAARVVEEGAGHAAEHQSLEAMPPVRRHHHQVPIPHRRLEFGDDLAGTVWASRSTPRWSIASVCADAGRRS